MWNSVSAEGLRNISMIWTSYDLYGVFFAEPSLLEAKRLIFIDTVILLLPFSLGMYGLLQIYAVFENLEEGTSQIIKTYQPYART